MSEINLQKVTAANLAIAKDLLCEYGTYLYNDLKLMAGYDSFYKELEHFPDHHYVFPNGGFFIASFGGRPIGCAGFKRFDDYSCELKRMYIRPAFRGKGFGKALTRLMLDEIKACHYKRVLLDTNEEMPAAIKTYLKLGFDHISAYCVNSNPSPVFLQLTF